MAARIVLFVDYQNVYMGARDAFHSPAAPPPLGQIDPRRPGELIVRKLASDGELAEVRMYRGQPDQAREPRSYATVRRQCRAWERDPRSGYSPAGSATRVIGRIPVHRRRASTWPSRSISS